MTRAEQKAVNSMVQNIRWHNRGNFSNLAGGVTGAPGTNMAQGAGIQIAGAGGGNGGGGGTIGSTVTAQAGTRVVDVSGLRKHVQGQFTLIFNNNVTAGTLFSTASVMPVELFYYQNSCSKVGNNPNSLIPVAIPLEGAFTLMSSTWATVATDSSATTNYLLKAVKAQQNAASWNTPSVIFTWWDVNGNLNFGAPTSGYTSATMPTIQLACRETSYRSLFEMAGISSFNISKMKPFFTNGVPQSTNNINWKRGTFLGGTMGNPNSPQNALSAFQQNQNVVEINGSWAINKETGFLYGINMNEVQDSIVTTCDMWVDSALN